LYQQRTTYQAAALQNETLSRRRPTTQTCETLRRDRRWALRRNAGRSSVFNVRTILLFRLWSGASGWTTTTDNTRAFRKTVTW